MNAKTLSIALLAGVPLVFTACGGDSLTLPSEGQPAHIVIEAGSGLQARVGTPLEPKLLAKVTDSQGRPVSGATVQFVLDNNLGDGQVAPASGTTNADGEVTATLTLGSQVGDMTGKAQVPVANGAAPIEAPFIATALPADASGIAMFSGDGQSGPVGSKLSNPLVVKVTDAFGNPISGITVHWSAEGQGSVSDETTVTGDDGQTAVTRTLGPNAGQQTTLASADGLAGSPVTFASTATAGNASRIEIVSGDNQEAAAGTQLPQELVVRVLDQDGNPIIGRAVSWVIGTGAGSVNPETSQTNDQGQASTHWLLGGSPGANTVNAVVSGIGSVTFHANGTGTGSPSNLAVTTQPPSPLVIGATMSPGPVVQVRDAAGHDLAVAGVNVTAALQGHGQLAGTTTLATDGNGRAQFNDLRVTGSPGSYKLIFVADGYRSATSDKFDVVKASTTTAVSQNSESSNPGEPVTVTFTVSSPSGTPSGQVVVTVSGGNESCSGAAPSGSCQLVLTETGDRTITATYQGDSNFDGSNGTVSHHVNEPLPPPNTPPVASDDNYLASPGESFHVPSDTRFGLLANDADLDNDPLSVTTATVVTSQGVTVNIAPDGSFDYTAPAAPTAADTFSYTISDGRGGTATATVTISFGG